MKNPSFDTNAYPGTKGFIIQEYILLKDEDIHMKRDTRGVLACERFSSRQRPHSKVGGSLFLLL